MTQVVTIDKEMGYTHADFFRLLPRAMGDNPYVIDGLQVQCTLPSGSLKITLGKECERRLFLVVMPYTNITFEYYGVSEEDRETFIKYFDLRFMKGLG